MKAATIFDLVSWVILAGACIWVLASTFREGLWGNSVNFFCTVFAFGFAFGLGIPMGGILMKALGLKDLFWIMALFSVSISVAYLVPYAVLRTTTNSLSRIKVDFHQAIDTAGSVIFMLALCATIRLLSIGFHPVFPFIFATAFDNASTGT